MGYCTSDDISGYGEEFNIPSAWSADNVTQVIADVTDVINRVTGDNFESVSKAILFDGNNRSTLFLTRKTPLRLLSVTQIQFRSDYDSTDNFDDDGEIIVANSYVPYPHYVVKVQSSETTVRSVGNDIVWRLGNKNYKLTGVWGHSLVPEGIKWCTVLLARERIRPGSTAPYAMKQSVRHVGTSYSLPYPGLLPVATGVPAVDMTLVKFVNRVPLWLACG